MLAAIMAGGLAGCITGAIASLAMTRRRDNRLAAKIAEDRASIAESFRKTDKLLADMLETNGHALDELIRSAVENDPLGDFSLDLGEIDFSIGKGDAPECMP